MNIHISPLRKEALNMKVYERLAAAFTAEGMTTVFGLMGDGNMYWMEALDKLGVTLVECRHEGVGCGMADGWARAIRDVGVCTATCGPGVSQLATALVTASRAESPMVAFVGESPTAEAEYHQRLDQSRFAAACETGFIRLNSASQTDEVVRKAFYMARLESRPIMLSAPMDVQQQRFEDDDAYEPSPRLPLSQAQPVQPDMERLRDAADIVAGSCKPVVIVGRGAMWANAGDAVLRLGNRIGALLATSLRAKGWLADNDYHVGISGHYATRTAMQLFVEADCVIAVGAGLNRFTVMGNLLYPNARFVHIDNKPRVMMGGARFADCYVQADARVGVEALDKLLAERAHKGIGYRTPDVKKKLVGHFEDRAEFPIEEGCLDPRDVCSTLDEIVPSTISLAIGSGTNAAGFGTMLCNRARPLVMASHYFGCIGQMFPAAMGAVMATGNRPMMLIDGDASAMMHLADFDTAVRHELPLLHVVLNDQALGAEYHKMNAHHMKSKLATIPTPDLGGFARSFGGRGALAHTIDEVRAAAKEWVANPGPMIIDARISRNVLTLPYRRSLYARDE